MLTWVMWLSHLWNIYLFAFKWMFYNQYAFNILALYRQFWVCFRSLVWMKLLLLAFNCFLNSYTMKGCVKNWLETWRCSKYKLSDFKIFLRLLRSVGDGGGRALEICTCTLYKLYNTWFWLVNSVNAEFLLVGTWPACCFGIGLWETITL